MTPPSFGCHFVPLWLGTTMMPHQEGGVHTIIPERFYRKSSFNAGFRLPSCRNDGRVEVFGRRLTGQL
jgi:hypothetical protein